MFRPTLHGAGGFTSLGLKFNCRYFKEHLIWTRDGGSWDVGLLHQAMTHTTHRTRHHFNTTGCKAKKREA